MPSHISHALLVEAALESLTVDRLDCSLTDDPRVHSVTLLGSQGPDVFLHNHRRKPRAFRYGALLHRKGNAGLVSSLARSAAEIRVFDPTDDDRNRAFLEVAAFTLGYISHVWLDRIMHPYINYSAGWRGVPDRDPDRPAMHAFLERIIDVQLLRYRCGVSVQEFRFFERLPSSSDDLAILRTHVARAIRSSLRSAGDDHLLEQRLANALFDSLSYYRHTESPSPEYFVLGRAREREGSISSRWLSVVHPPEELITLDGLNRVHRYWQHPCDPSRTSHASVPDLFDRARKKTIEVFLLWWDATGSPENPERTRVLETALGEENLNDGITGDPPCRRQVCDPLPLLTLYRQMKRAFDR